MEFRDGHAMSIDADIRIIRHMLDIARYCRIMRKLMRISASAWLSLIGIEEAWSILIFLQLINPSVGKVGD